MIVCPDCGHENIPGVDACEKCQQPLSTLTASPAESLSEQFIATDPIALLAPNRPIIVVPETPVGEVLQTLIDRHVGCVLVGEGEQILGIFSERDALLRLNTQAAELRDEPIRRFMTPSPTMLAASDSIAFALHRMDVGGFRHIPVTTDGAVTGMISVRDILRYVAERLVTAR